MVNTYIIFYIYKYKTVVEGRTKILKCLEILEILEINK